MAKTQQQTRRWMAPLGFALLAIGAVLDLLWMDRQPAWIVYVINLLPGMQLLAAWQLETNYPDRRTGLARFGIPLTVVALAFAAVINVMVDFATSFIVELDQYPQMVAEFHDSTLVAHFPPEIPDEAHNRSFFAVSGALRQARVMQLRYELPAEQIAALLEMYQSQAVYEFLGGDASEHVDLPDGVPTTYFYTGDGESYAFPESFTILVLDAQVEKLTGDGVWKHGYSYGVAISVEESEIVYWLEEW
jgi:hypothetical protein